MIKLKQIILQEGVSNVVNDYSSKVDPIHIYLWNSIIPYSFKNRDTILRYACKLFLNETNKNLESKNTVANTVKNNI